MRLIATDASTDIASMLDGYDVPAILVSAEYQILATNDLYQQRFGDVGAETSD